MNWFEKLFNKKQGGILISSDKLSIVLDRKNRMPNFRPFKPVGCICRRYDFPKHTLSFEIIENDANNCPIHKPDNDTEVRFRLGKLDSRIEACTGQEFVALPVTEVYWPCNSYFTGKITVINKNQMKNIIRITEERILTLKEDVKVMERRIKETTDQLTVINFEIEETTAELKTLTNAFPPTSK